MNKKYFFFWLTIVTIVITLFSACRERVTDVSLNKNELILSPGDTETLVATVYPDDADNKKVTWKSSNTNVAEVSNVGLVTAISDGKAIITVTTKDGNHKAECSVTVDYRNKWVGNYEGVKTSITSLGAMPPTETYDTIPDYKVNVSLCEDSCLYISNKISKVKVDGSFSGGEDWFWIGGSFKNDTLSYSFWYVQGMAYSYSCEFKGRKL